MDIIRVSHLRKSYGTKEVLRGIDLAVAEGEIVGILGPNGSGKTTLVECIGGLRTPDSGSITVAGMDPHTQAADLRTILGMQLQQCRLPAKITVDEALSLYSAFYPNPRPAEELLERFDLAEQRKTQFSQLSGGQQQRLSVALALIGRSRIAFLDELTTGLDPSARRHIWAYLTLLRDEGVTLVLVTHFMEEAQFLCDRVAVIDDGVIVAEGTPEAVAGGSGTQELSFDSSDANTLLAVRALPGLSDAQADRGRILIRTHADSASAVVAALANAGIPTPHLRIDTPTLDDAFLNLTERHSASKTRP